MFVYFGSSELLTLGSAAFFGLAMLALMSHWRGNKGPRTLAWIAAMLTKSLFLFYLALEATAPFTSEVLFITLTFLIMLTLLDNLIICGYSNQTYSKIISIFAFLFYILLLAALYRDEQIFDYPMLALAFGVTVILHIYGLSKISAMDKISNLIMYSAVFLYSLLLVLNILETLPQLSEFLMSSDFSQNSEEVFVITSWTLVYFCFMSFILCSLMTLIIWRDSAAIQTRLSALDKVTGALNIEGFVEASQRIRHMCSRLDQQVSLVAIKVDNVDDLNRARRKKDRNGILRKFVKSVEYCLRKHDQIAYLGEDRFLILLPFTDMEKARLATIRLVKHLATEIWDDENVYASLQVKVGVTDLLKREPSLEDGINRALQAMENSKHDHISMIAAPKITHDSA